MREERLEQRKHIDVEPEKVRRVVRHVVNDICVEAETCDVDEVADVGFVEGLCGDFPDVVLYEVAVAPAFHDFGDGLGVVVGAHPVVATTQGQYRHIDFMGVHAGSEYAVDDLVDGAVAARRHNMAYPVLAQFFSRFDALARSAHDMQFISDVAPF